MEKIEMSMEQSSSQQLVKHLLQAIGVTIGGKEPWDVQIYNDQFYDRALKEGSLGLGESYMEKWWDCQRLDILFDKILRADLQSQVQIPLQFKLKHLINKVINFQTKRRAKEVAIKHYNLDNHLFAAMLDSRMIYSCGYFKDTTDLDAAQLAKLDLICRKLQLEPGMRLLDIGCGWGGLARYAAEHYKVQVVGFTISQQQADFAKNYCQQLPIEIRLQDYRDIGNEKFDRIVSVGMFEHVGHLNYRTFMNVVHRTLTDNGLFLLHTIGANETSLYGNEWISKYIFPNGLIPSIQQIAQAAEQLFIMEDWHNFGAYYDNTLMAWYHNFVKNWHSVEHKFNERFYRMWTFYLLSCAGSFRARTNQLWQIVFSKKGLVGGYNAPR